MSYRVGQILYVVLRKEARVFPVMVVKEVTEKTMEGTNITYMIRANSSADGERVLPIGDVDGEFFDTAEKVKRALIARATDNIHQRVDAAANKAREWYVGGFEEASDDDLASLRKDAPPAAKKPNAETAELAAELKQEADGMIIQLPDGKKARARVKLPPALQD